MATALGLAFAACTTTAPTPTATPPTPTRPPSVTASAKSSVPPPSAGRAVIDLFLSDFAAAQPPFHVDADVRISGSSTASVTIRMDTSGDDYEGTVHADVAGEVTDAEVVSVDGVAYRRTDSTGWEVVPAIRQTQPINPFCRLDATQIAYIGPVERSARILHQLRTTTWIGEDIDDLELDPIASPVLADPVFDIFVGDDGIPQEAQLRFAITGTVDEEPVQIDYAVDYRFSAVGVPVEIEAPEVIATPAATATPVP